MINFKDLKTAELEAWIEQFVQAGAEAPEGLTNNPKRVDWLIETSEAMKLEAHVLTEADLESNPGLVDEGLGEGDMILIPTVEETDEEVDEEEVDADVDSSAPPASDDAVQVFTPSGRFIRAYSEADHGEDYEALAESFVKKNTGKPICELGECIIK